MDTPVRSIVKACTWQILGLIVTVVIGYLFTGSWQTAGGFALTLQLLALVSYVIHERIWNRLSWGRIAHAVNPAAPSQG